jgi:hypothetical protein
LTLEDLAREARHLQAWAWVESTKKSMNSGQRCFIKFCDMYSVTAFLVDGQTLVLYATYLVMSGKLKKVGSVKQYLSHVSTLHKMFGVTCHTPHSYGPLLFTVRGI